MDLVNEIQSDGFYNALYYYLLHYDIKEFHPNIKPTTVEDDRLLSESGTVPQFVNNWHIV